MMPFLTADGQELWFNRTYMGTPAVYRSKKVNGQWQTPELIVSQFAGEPTLDWEGNLYFVHHYYKDNQMMEADIYVCRRK
jgi:rhamnogalacturonyl hydrolase YesR